MSDLKSKKMILFKGFLFALLSVSSCLILLLDSFSLRTAFLLAVLVWSSCRFYYFLFYVIERYVDPSFRYAGMMSLFQAFRAKQRAGRKISEDSG